MQHLTRKAVRVDATASRHIGGEVKIQDISDKILGLILNGPTINGVNKDVLRHLLRQLYDELQGYEEREGWIPVTERLPDPFVSVLAYLPNHAPCPTVHECYISSDGAWCSGVVYGVENDDVTHWMPPPEPPKEDA